jgi:hypothetical protein
MAVLLGKTHIDQANKKNVFFLLTGHALFAIKAFPYGATH